MKSNFAEKTFGFLNKAKSFFAIPAQSDTQATGTMTMPLMCIRLSLLFSKAAKFPLIPR